MQKVEANEYQGNIDAVNRDVDEIIAKFNNKAKG